MTFESVRFPDILIFGNQFYTNVRTKHTDGKYYLVKFLIVNYSSTDVECVKSLIHNVYAWLHFGKINPELKDSWGAPQYILDADQREEPVRLQETYSIHII